MKVLCLMGLFPQEYEHEVIENSKRGVQNAANKFQWGLVNGLDGIDGVDVTILNSLYIGSYPRRYKQLRVPTFEFSHNGINTGINVGFTNLTAYKTLSKYHSLKKRIDAWMQQNRGESRVVMAYAMTSPMVELLKYVKKKYPDAVCCLVVPDLPEYMSASAKKFSLYSILKKVQIKRFKRLLRPIDCYVLLTDYMSEWFDFDIKYTVVEGICSKKPEQYEPVPHTEKKKSILYAGMIEEKYGVVDLCEAFCAIEAEDWSLELFGRGSSLPKIQKLAESDSRVHIRGMAPNAEVLEEQRLAGILINPRNDNNEFTKYSFPSKVIEYLSSGTPMIGYKLSGMPREYVDHFYCISPNEGGMKACMQKVMSLSEEERAKKGKEAFLFVTEQKGAVKQCEKIVSMFCELQDKKQM